MSNPNRVPEGSPEGGQFAAGGAKPESSGTNIAAGGSSFSRAMMEASVEQNEAYVSEARTLMMQGRVGVPFTETYTDYVEAMHEHGTASSGTDIATLKRGAQAAAARRRGGPRRFDAPGIDAAEAADADAADIAQQLSENVEHDPNSRIDFDALRESAYADEDHGFERRESLADLDARDSDFTVEAESRR